MIEIINVNGMSGCSAIATCLPASRPNVTGVSGVVVSGGERVVGVERPTKAPEAAVVHGDVYVSGFAANGAAQGRQRTQLKMWALRGHDPWSYPA